MGAFSSNGAKPYTKRAPSKKGGFFTGRQKEWRPFFWQEVDGDLLRMTLDALTRKGYGMAFFVAQGGRGIKVRIYAEGPASDEVVIDAGEFNGLMDWMISDLRSGDEELQQLFEEVSSWLESRNA